MPWRLFPTPVEPLPTDPCLAPRPAEVVLIGPAFVDACVLYVVVMLLPIYTDLCGDNLANMDVLNWVKPRLPIGDTRPPSVEATWAPPVTNLESKLACLLSLPGCVFAIKLFTNDIGKLITNLY